MASASPESLSLRRQSARIQRQSRVPVYVDNNRSPIRKRNYTTNVRTPEKKEAKSTTMTKDELYVAEKELLARRRFELLDEEGKLIKKASPLKRRRVDAEAVQTEEESGVVVLSESAKKENVVKSDDGVKAENKAVGVIGNVGEKSDYAKVKETLRVFNKHYLNFVQEEEKRCRKEVVDSKSPKSPEKLEKGSAKMDSGRKSPKSSEKDLKGNAKDGSKKSLKKAAAKKKSKKEGVTKEVTKKMAKRPDLKAITKMMDSKAVLNPEKRIGEVPGLKVGYQFYSRAEMVVLGFHGHWLNGIYFLGTKYKKVKEFETYQFPFAVSIVLSGMYEDDLDNADEVVYTGSGGHNLNGDKRQIKDQELLRGNLALKNCIANDTPIRVTRGHENKSSYTGKVYTYDGLYKVTKYWADKGISGFTVYKYLLRRVPGQPILTTKPVVEFHYVDSGACRFKVHFAFGQVPQSISELRGLVCEDIAGGQENFPIPATNLVDDPPVPPTGFKYISSLKVSKGIKIPAAASGCSCKGSCMDPTTCACAKLNGFDFPYVQRDGGRLIEAKDVVYECGPKCGCGPNCINRVSQGGLKFRLEVFRAPRKGWAVRSWDFIPAGAPVCEYIGVLRRSDDVESSWENNYIFDIDCLQTMGGLGGREKRSGDVSDTTGQTDGNYEQPEFCIDAGSSGNIARFINHSCEPNLFVQCVLSSHHDMKLARVMLFAADNIPPLQELVYDYGYALDSVLGPDGKVKQMICYCGAADCRKRLL